MQPNRHSRFIVWTASVAVLALGGLAASCAQQSAIEIDSDDIGGVVTGPNGPEAGVWVIAETNDLDVRYIKSVVTDDEGRYVVPDLPEANYDVWARGYGLVDSAKSSSTPGQLVDITATPAPTPADAAQYYPAIHWYSMLKIPAEEEFGGANPRIQSGVTQTSWLNGMRSNGCIGCHQIGQAATRTVPEAFGTFESGEAAWTRRIQSGQSGAQMLGALTRLGGQSVANYGDWLDRIADGELPRTVPERPQGVERNIVVTVRDWMNERQYLHDMISTDKRNPTVNGYGSLFGSPEYSSDVMPILDPVSNTTTAFTMPVRDEDMALSLGPGHAAALDALQPSAYWGSERIWDTKANNHNSMLDSTGRVWLTAAIRESENPDFCKEGSDHPSAVLTPLDNATRHLAMFDPDTQDYTFIDTCFGNHHPQFGFDENETLWTSGGGPVVGWLDTKKFDETGDAAQSQGWTALILDTNGNGERDEYVEADQPIDPSKDKRLIAGFYAVMPSPVDGSIWGSRAFGTPGSVMRLDPGDNPPSTALAEIYNVPSPGFGPRGADIDGEGVVWVSLASGHLASFDRRKCTAPLNGPEAATGDHCPEGWTFHQYPGPGFEGIGDNSAESSYYTWVDQHNTLGLGDDVPISTGNLNDGLIAFDDGEMVVLRVPYPMGFYAKGLDGRIDDPDAGWKGRGLWSASGDRTPWLMEGGKGTKPLAVHFQLRPDPLAK